MVSVLGTIWVPDITGGPTSVFKIAFLVDLESVDSLRNASELTNEADIVTNLLLNRKAARGLRVSDEVELAAGFDSLSGLRGVLEVEVSWLNVSSASAGWVNCALAAVDDASGRGRDGTSAASKDSRSELGLRGLSAEHDKSECRCDLGQHCFIDLGLLFYGSLK